MTIMTGTGGSSNGRSSPDLTVSGSISGSESHRSRSTSAATDANSLAALEPDNSQRPSEAAFAKARANRPEVCGSYAPERPYPIYLRGVVERGFGRGGKDLGCPTANLPSKVFQTQANLQRTGVYFGFARVLPQDPDDPDLLAEGQDISDQEDKADARAETQLESHVADDDIDPDFDDDGDEVILSASPIHEADDVSDGGHRLRESGPGDVHYLVKPRQMSRSSARSSRSVRTILEKAGQLDLDRNPATSAAAANTSQEATGLPAAPVSSGATGLAISAGTSEGDKGQNALEPSPAIAQKTAQDASAASAQRASHNVDKHPREASGSSSKTGSLRRKKKRRVPLSIRDARVYPMVMSVGWNPFYNNTSKTAEVHIMNKFANDFYGLEMRVVVLGYIRPEYNYVSKEALIEDIETDKRVAIRSLARSPYQDYITDPFLLAPS